MSLAENKKVALEFFDAVAHGDVARMSGLMTTDATWWVAPSNKFSGTHQKEDFLAIVPTLFAEASGPFRFRFDEITAEEDRVSVTAKGNLKMKSGKTYQSDYHFLLKIRNGKIAVGKEYADSAHINEIFGPA
jgi:ketosteroid isomerase-like protein